MWGCGGMADTEDLENLSTKIGNFLCEWWLIRWKSHVDYVELNQLNAVNV